MSIKLQNEHIRLSGVVCSKCCYATVEGDVIVPDIKPDILKILQVDTDVTINHKAVQSDKIYVQGVVRLNILYIPDIKESGRVKSITTTQEFNNVLDVSGAMPDMDFAIEAKCRPCEYTLVNSRKLSTRTGLEFLIRLSRNTDIDFATGLENECDIEIKTRKMKLFNPCIDAMREVVVHERLEVPQGKPSICEVLKVSATPSSTELRLLAGKAHAKGEVKICTLYCSDEDCIEVMEHTVQFSEVLEIEGLTETMTGEVDYSVRDCYFEVCPDSDGDKRILKCEIVLEGAVRASETVECTVIEDAYGTCCGVELEKESYSLEQLTGSFTQQLTIKEPVSIPDYLPPIQRLCDCSAKSTIENISVDGNCVTVSGTVGCSFLYLSGEQTMPIAGFAHILPFSQSFEAEGIKSDSLCDAKAEVIHTSCTINGDKVLEIRAIVQISLKVITPCTARLISGISLNTEKKFPKAPSARIYFVQKGDTLWDIAKKYHTSPDELMSSNQLDSEILPVGKCIYIFK